jgi:glucose/mannose-6-phosphate isomerase
LIKELIQKFDSQNTFEVIKNFPDQISEAVKIGKNLKINAILKETINDIVISGLGGSAIGGDLIKNLLKDKINIPIIVNRDYFLPKFVNEKTLVIISSYSGNTEETISIYRHAIENKSQIICITSGGEVKRIAEQYHHNLVIIPKGYQPRLALGFLFFGMIYILIHLGLLDEPTVDINSMLEVLKRRSKIYSDLENENPALDLAKKLKDKLIFIYSTPCLESVGLRWRGQLSENSKVISSTHTFPELNHNEIVAWTESGGLSDILKNASIIILKDIDDFIRIKYRLEITKKILKSYTSNLFEFEGEGESILVRIFDLLYLIDWTSYYLAILNNADPAEIKNIEFLKQQLALIKNE